MSEQMEKDAINRGMLLKALLGGGAAAGLGAAGGYGMAKHRYSPAALSAAHPGGGYAGDYMGPRNALEEFQEQMQEAQSEEEMLRALQEAESSGIVFKGASDWSSTFQKHFADEVTKIGMKVASDLKAIQAISPETYEDVEKSAGDIEKVARVLVAHGYADAMLSELDPQ